MQAYVTVVDEKMNKLMKEFAANAKYFEQRAPWEDKYKLDAPHPPIVNTVEALIETARLRCHHHRRKSAQRSGDSRQIWQQEFYLYRLHARVRGGARRQGEQ